MKSILVVGAGVIGSTVCKMFTLQGCKNLTCVDFRQDNLDAVKKRCKSLVETIREKIQDYEQWLKPTDNYDVVVSCVAGWDNLYAAELAAKLDADYYDFSEDEKSTEAIHTMFTRLFEKKKYSGKVVTNCGVAPGFVQILARRMIDCAFGGKELNDLTLYCGALPTNPVNKLKYNPTWSIKGLVNEYTSPTIVQRSRQLVEMPALTNVESIMFDGNNCFEAFTTSGGLGYIGQLKYLKNHTFNMDYKTLRYHGHRDYIDFLVNDLQMTKAEIELAFEKIPTTNQDVVWVAVRGSNGIKTHTYTYKFITDLLYTHNSLEYATVYSFMAMYTLTQGKEIRNGIISHDDITWKQFSENNEFADLLNEHQIT